MASKSRRNKVKFKLTKELILLIACLVAMITATVVMAIPTKAERALEKYNTAITDYNTKNETQFGFLDKDNVFKELNFHANFTEGDANNLKNQLNHEYVYIYYGSLTNGDYLQNLSVVNAKAKENDIDNVYLAFTNFIEEEEDINSTTFFDNTLKPIQDVLNVKNADVKEDNVDLTDTKNPILLVYSNGELMFNSQTYKKNPEYNWNIIINKAFTIGKNNSNKETK